MRVTTDLRFQASQSHQLVHGNLAGETRKPDINASDTIVSTMIKNNDRQWITVVIVFANLFLAPNAVAGYYSLCNKTSNSLMFVQLIENVEGWFPAPTTIGYTASGHYELPPGKCSSVFLHNYQWIYYGVFDPDVMRTIKQANGGRYDQSVYEKLDASSQRSINRKLFPYQPRNPQPIPSVCASSTDEFEYTYSESNKSKFKNRCIDGYFRIPITFGARGGDNDGTMNLVSTTDPVDKSPPLDLGKVLDGLLGPRPDKATEEKPRPRTNKTDKTPKPARNSLVWKPGLRDFTIQSEETVISASDIAKAYDDYNFVWSPEEFQRARLTDNVNFQSYIAFREGGHQYVAAIKSKSMIFAVEKIDVKELRKLMAALYEKGLTREEVYRELREADAGFELLKPAEGSTAAPSNVSDMFQSLEKASRNLSFKEFAAIYSKRAASIHGGEPYQRKKGHPLAHQGG
ncbi:MAG: hypothetical protein AAGH76_06120 [Pseudomonadota bacterium]